MQHAITALTKQQENAECADSDIGLLATPQREEIDGQVRRGHRAQVAPTTCGHAVDGAISPECDFIRDSLSAAIIATIWSCIWTLSLRSEKHFYQITICPDNDTGINIATESIIPTGYE